MGRSAQELLGSDTNLARPQVHAAARGAAPCGRAEGSANLGSDPKNSGDSRGAECPVGLIHPTCCEKFGSESFQKRSVPQLTTQMRLVTLAVANLEQDTGIE